MFALIALSYLLSINAFVWQPMGALRVLRKAPEGASELASRTLHMSAGSSFSPVVDIKPATTFMGCVSQAVDAATAALADGQQLMEIDFPSLPIEYLEDSASSARDIADANTRWAFEFAKSFTYRGKVAIIYPDGPELQDAIRYCDISL